MASLAFLDLPPERKRPSRAPQPPIGSSRPGVPRRLDALGVPSCSISRRNSEIIQKLFGQDRGGSLSSSSAFALLQSCRAAAESVRRPFVATCAQSSSARLAYWSTGIVEPDVVAVPTSSSPPAPSPPQAARPRHAQQKRLSASRERTLTSFPSFTPEGNRAAYSSSDDELFSGRATSRLKLSPGAPRRSAIAALTSSRFSPTPPEKARTSIPRAPWPSRPPPAAIRYVYTRKPSSSSSPAERCQPRLVLELSLDLSSSDSPAHERDRGEPRGRSSGRVAVRTPSSGLKPIVVSTDLPSPTAVTEQPPPR